MSDPDVPAATRSSTPVPASPVTTPDAQAPPHPPSLAVSGTPTRTRTARAGTPPLWRSGPFASFWAGQTISVFGDQISTLALPLIAVTALHATPWQVSLLTAALWAPNLLALPLGAWVDRQPTSRPMLITADLARAAALTVLPVAAALGWLHLPLLLAVAAATGTGAALFSSSYSPFFVTLVSRDRYLDANSALSTSRSAAQVAGPALGGTLVAALGAPVAVLADALSFIASAVLIIRTRPSRPSRSPTHSPPPPPANGPRPSWIAQLRLVGAATGVGVTHLLHHPLLRAALGCVATMNFFGAITTAELVLFATRTLHLSPAAIGLALGVGAAGGLAAAVAAPALSARYGMGRMTVLGAIACPLPTAAIALAGGPPWLAAVVLGASETVSSAAVMLFDVNLNAIQAAATPDELRARITGAFITLNYGTRPLGALTGGLLATTLGLRPTLLIAALAATAAFIWLLPSPIPSLRTLDDLPATDPPVP